MNPIQALRAFDAREFLDSLDPAKALRIAIGAWLFFAMIVGIVVAVRPDKHTVTPEYRQASQKWWAGATKQEPHESLYDGSQVGYLYLPQEAIIYTPFQLLPKPIGEPLWRWTGLTLLFLGIWRVAGLLNAKNRERLFLAATLLVIPSALSSASNGQVNLPLAGLILLTTAELAQSRWNFASLWLVLAILLKPIALAPALLAAACFAPLRLRLIVGLTLAFAVTYLHPNPAFVTGEYQHFWAKFLLAGQPLDKDNFSDFFGMLWHWNIHPAPLIISGLRALAAGITLIASLFAMRRFRGEPIFQALAIMLLAALFLMLFNPRTEENSFVMLAGFTALLSASNLVAGSNMRGKYLAVFTLLLAVENYGFIYHLTRIWFKPLISFVFLVTLIASNFSFLKPSAPRNLPS